MIKLFEQNAIDFTNNGILVLDNITYTCYTKEVINGNFYVRLSIRHSTEEWSRIKRFMILSVPTHRGDMLFRIKQLNIDDKNLLHIYAQHIWFDMDDNFIDDIFITNSNGQQAGDRILASTQFPTPWKFNSNITDVKNMRIVRRYVSSAFMGTRDNSFSNRWGGELELNNFEFSLNVRRGNTNHIRLFHGKNIKSFDMKETMQGVATRLVPIAFDGITLPEMFVESNNVNDFPHPIVRTLQLPNYRLRNEEDDEYVEEEESTNYFDTVYELWDAMRHHCRELFDNGKDRPIENIRVNMLELSKVAEYAEWGYNQLEEVHIGDNIEIEVPTANRVFNQRCISITYNTLTGNRDEVEIGEFRQHEDVPQVDLPPMITDSNIATTPPRPITGLHTINGFSSIMVVWDSQGIGTRRYELFASTEDGFEPAQRHLIFSGNANAFQHNVRTRETWFFRIRSINRGGEPGPFSQQVYGSTSEFDLDGLEGRVSENEQKVSDAMDRIDEVIDSIPTEEQMSNLEDRLGANSEAIDNLVTDTLPALDYRLGTAEYGLNNAINAIQDLGSLEDGTSLGDLFYRLNANESAIEIAKEDITNASERVDGVRTIMEEWRYNDTVEIDGGAIRAGTVTARQIQAGSITAVEIEAGTITGDRLVMDSITGREIGAEVITSAHILSGTITGDRIVSNSITTRELFIGDTENLAQFSENVPNSVLNADLAGLGGIAITNDPDGFTRLSQSSNNNNTFPISARRPNTFVQGDSFRVSFDIWVSGQVTQPQLHFRRLPATGTTALGHTATNFEIPVTGQWVRVEFNSVGLPSQWNLQETSFYTISITGFANVTVHMRNVIVRRRNNGHLIVDGSITAGHLNADIIQGRHIEARTIEAINIKSGTITAEEIEVGTITANEIAVGGVTGDRIAANTIHTRHLIISDFTNLVDNGTFENDDVGTIPNGWVIAGATRVAHVTGTGNGSNRCLNIPRVSATGSTIVRTDRFIPVNAGDSIRLEMMCRVVNTSGTSGGPIIGIESFNANKQLISWTGGVRAPRSTIWQKYTRNQTVDNGVHYIRIVVGGDVNAVGAAVEVDDIVARVRNNGQMIVDGAITADHIEVRSITSNRIAANAITATEISAGAIEATHIGAGAIEAHHIRAGHITGDMITGGEISGVQFTTLGGGSRINMLSGRLDVLNNNVLRTRINNQGIHIHHTDGTILGRFTWAVSDAPTLPIRANGASINAFSNAYTGFTSQQGNISGSHIMRLIVDGGTGSTHIWGGRLEGNLNVNGQTLTGNVFSNGTFTFSGPVDMSGSNDVRIWSTRRLTFRNFGAPNSESDQTLNIQNLGIWTSPSGSARGVGLASGWGRAQTNGSAGGFVFLNNGDVGVTWRGRTDYFDVNSAGYNVGILALGRIRQQWNIMQWHSLAPGFGTTWTVNYGITYSSTPTIHDSIQSLDNWSHFSSHAIDHAGGSARIRVIQRHPTAGGNQQYYRLKIFVSGRRPH